MTLWVFCLARNIIVLKKGPHLITKKVIKKAKFRRCEDEVNMIIMKQLEKR